MLEKGQREKEIQYNPASICFRQQAFLLRWPSASDCPPPMVPSPSQPLVPAYSPRHSLTQAFHGTRPVAANQAEGGSDGAGRAAHDWQWVG